MDNEYGCYVLGLYTTQKPVNSENQTEVVIYFYHIFRDFTSDSYSFNSKNTKNPHWQYLAVQ